MGGIVYNRATSVRILPAIPLSAGVLLGALLAPAGPARAAPGPAAPSATALPARPDLARAEALFAGREDPKKLESAAELFETAKEWTRAARACYQRITIHDDLDSDDDARERWIDRGLASGLRALGAKDADEVLEAMPRYEKPRAAALYWYAALYGRKIELVNVFRQAGMASTFRRLAARAAELDGACHHGGPRRMLGDFLCSAPGLFGGDEAKGAQELEAAIAAEPRYLEGYVLRAKRVRVAAKDRAGFRADLERVLAAPDDALPDVVPEQRVAKKRARALLAREAELFD